MLDVIHSFDKPQAPENSAGATSGTRFARPLALLAAASIAAGCIGFASVSPAMAEPTTASLTAPVVTPASLEVPAGQRNSRTEHKISMLPTTYGDLFVATGAVHLDGPANLSGKMVQYLIDGVVVSEAALIYGGSGKFVPLMPFLIQPDAGEHTFSMRFPGAPATADFPAVAPSQSEPTAFTVAQAPTTTVITSAPSTMTAFSAVDVAATVTSARPSSGQISGVATLLADGAPIQSEGLASDGTVTFAGAQVPWGTSALTVAFTGDAAGNLATSVSAGSPINIAPLGTSGSLSLSSDRIRAIDGVVVGLEVRAGGLGSQIDPRGGIEIFIDGRSVYAETSASDSDPTPGDGIARFNVTLGDITPGEHVITASYMPAPGFGAATIAPVTLHASAVGTVLTPTITEVHGTLTQPTIIDVAVGLDEPVSTSAQLATQQFAPGGTVQMFVGSNPIGDPFAVTDGVGRGTLSGLSAGTHEVELRFIPDTPGLLRSSASVTVKIAADKTPDTTPDQSEQPSETPAQTETHTAALAQTGAEEQAGLLLGGAALLLGAGTALTVARLRRH